MSLRLGASLAALAHKTYQHSGLLYFVRLIFICFASS
jgi:hypothetical protein